MENVPLCHWATSTLNALSVLFRLKDPSCSRQIFACDFLIADRLPRLLNIEAGTGVVLPRLEEELRAGSPLAFLDNRRSQPDVRNATDSSAIAS